MKFRFGSALHNLRVLACALAILGFLPVHADAPPPGVPEKVMVWVRDGHGAPVPGLTVEDFIVTENGVHNRILAVEPFVAPNVAPSGPAPKITRDRSGTDASKAAQFVTHVLLILPPMAAAGRHNAIHDALRFLAQPGAQDWRIALFDDQGGYVPETSNLEQLRTALRRLEHHTSAPQFRDGPWSPAANRAVSELSMLPGRHAIVLPTDFYGPTGKDRWGDRWRLRIAPSNFIRAAIGAQAPLYTIQTTGPEPVVPGGEASESLCDPTIETGDGYLTGDRPATKTWAATVAAGAVRSNFLQAADETGGADVRDLQEAFQHIANDAAGYYFVTFEARPEAYDGTLHPFSVTVRNPRLHVRGRRMYLAPSEQAGRKVPPELEQAQDSPDTLPPMQVAANAWLFPQPGQIHYGTVAADLTWTSGAKPPAPGSRLQILAKIADESTQMTLGAWYEERDWPLSNKPITVHWQREAHFYPGPYRLRVVARDTASGLTSVGTYNFVARPLDGIALRISATVLASDCLPPGEAAKLRHSLFDPMRVGECILAPNAAARFQPSEDPMLLVRLYPPGGKFADLILKQWSAFAVVDGATEKAMPLNIAPAPVRGLEVSGKLLLSQLHLSPGPHALTILFRANPADPASKWLPLHTQFSIEP